MEGVKRAKSVQKKIVHNIFLSFSPTQMLFQLDEELTVWEYLSAGCFLLAHLEAFSYIALCKVIRITRWHIPCDFM